MEEKFNHIEFENRIMNMFTNVGWECTQGHIKGNCFEFDIMLKKDNEIFGFVETYYVNKSIRNNPKYLSKYLDKILKRIKILSEEIKPEILIITDGNIFENYFYGKYFGQTTIPIGYKEYLTIKSEYENKVKNSREE